MQHTMPAIPNGVNGDGVIYGTITTRLGGKGSKSRKPRTAVGSIAPSPVLVAGKASIRWVAMGGVGLTATLSAALNGYNYAQHAPSPWAGWALGVAIPALILILGRVWAGRRGMLAGWVAMVAGLGLLALSVGHCAASIAAVTGSSMWLAVPLAVAIDAGLVACELALLDE